jgi:hypothetical protein
MDEAILNCGTGVRNFRFSHFGAAGKNGEHRQT